MKETLDSHTSAELRKEVSETNIEKCAESKKPALMELMIEREDDLTHSEKKEEKGKKKLTLMEEEKSKWNERDEMGDGAMTDSSMIERKGEPAKKKPRKRNPETAPKKIESKPMCEEGFVKGAKNRFEKEHGGGRTRAKQHEKWEVHHCKSSTFAQRKNACCTTSICDRVFAIELSA